MQIISHSLEGTEKAARQFLNLVAPREHATIVALSGELGSGKTTFTQAIARILGVPDVVQSPTFVIMKRYILVDSGFMIHESGFRNLIHIDAYRLEKGEELKKLGIKEVFKDPKNLILIEWPERIAEILPSDHFKISFEFVDETTRKIEFL